MSTKGNGPGADARRAREAMRSGDGGTFDAIVDFIFSKYGAVVGMAVLAWVLATH